MDQQKAERRDKTRTTVAIVVIALLAVLSGVLAALYVTAKAGQSAADERYRALAESILRGISNNVSRGDMMSLTK